MMATNRRSKNVKATDPKGLEKARKAESFERPPSARKKGKLRLDQDYEEGQAGADGKARKGPLYRRMRDLFAGDESLDPGVERVTQVPDLDDKVAEVESMLTVEERESLRVITTKTGAIQVRSRATGRIVKNPVPARRGKGGKFTSEVVTRIVVVDEEAFREAQERRASAIQTGFLSPKEETSLRRAAILQAIEDDRRRRGWDNVPSL